MLFTLMNLVLEIVLISEENFLERGFLRQLHYAQEANLKPARACMKVIGDVEKASEMILVVD